MRLICLLAQELRTTLLMVFCDKGTTKLRCQHYDALRFILELIQRTNKQKHLWELTHNQFLLQDNKDIVL
jgi:hypothetical protein